MKFVSYQADGQASAVIGDGIVELGRRLGGSRSDLQSALAAGTLARAAALAAATSADRGLDDVIYLPPIAAPEKIFCVGVNYANRNAEYKDGTEVPKYPSIFMRWPGSLVGHRQPIVRPPESNQLDYEGEIAIIIGKAGATHLRGASPGPYRRGHLHLRGYHSRLAAPWQVQRHPRQELLALGTDRSLDDDGGRVPAFQRFALVDARERRASAERYHG